MRAFWYLQIQHLCSEGFIALYYFSLFSPYPWISLNMAYYLLPLQFLHPSVG